MKQNKHKWFESIPVKQGGTYIVLTRSQHWGRGDTLADAVQNAADAGARSLLPKNVLIYWQPDTAWQNVKAEYPNSDAAKPGVGSDGTLYHWGGHVECLHRPEE